MDGVGEELIDRPCGGGGAGDDGGWGRLMVKVSVWFPVPVTLMAEIVMVVVAAVVGVPEMMPVAVLRSRPAGSPVALKLVGVLSAVMV